MMPRGDSTGSTTRGAAATTRLLTVVEAARDSGVSRSTVSSWITVGKLPAVLIDRKRRVRPTDVTMTHILVHVAGVVPAWRRERRRCGQRLRALREAAGLTQLELAARSGLIHEAISRWETGRKTPNAASVRQLAGVLGVEPARFTGQEDLAAVGLTTTAAAAWLGVPVSRVQAWLRTGELAGVKVSGQWRAPVAAVIDLDDSERLRGRSRRLDPRYRG